VVSLIKSTAFFVNYTIFYDINQILLTKNN
jgi:hypothetical protein